MQLRGDHDSDKGPYNPLFLATPPWRNTRASKGGREWGQKGGAPERATPKEYKSVD